MNADDSSLKTLNNIIEMIFDSNNEKVSVEILLVDYEDKITINIKYKGKKVVMKDISEHSKDNIKVSEVLGFNNIEYILIGKD